jgi:hypothetical protein
MDAAQNAYMSLTGELNHAYYRAKREIETGKSVDPNLKGFILGLEYSLKLLELCFGNMPPPPQNQACHDQVEEKNIKSS